MKLLAKINNPSDLKRLKISQLKILAQEIREVIIDTVAQRGGHLAPNLGVVELTIALHYVFSSPKDKIIWDVGHQCYAHKLLTGRRDNFATLRTYGGIAGFPKRAESLHDHLDTGHSSTSISAGLGMAVAKRLKKDKDGKIIVVIGDGSITGGLAFEGLNNAGYMKEDLLIILNDNEMSISPNVGALSSFISKRMTGNLARFVRHELEKFLHHLPGGENFLHLLKKGEDLLKIAITPGALFTVLNFEYVGPTDGHNLEDLISILQNLKKIHKPVVLHVLTKKGKGYPPAEADPETFHGVPPFERKTGKIIKKANLPPTYTEIFGKTVVRLAELDPRVVTITAAMKTGTGLTTFAERFPERFFDVGICEQHAVTFAAGLALEGLIPICAIYSTFLQRAYDQIIHDVALNKAKVIFAIDRAGLVGEDGPTHHGAFDLSYLRIVPNLIVMAPKDENELQHMLFSALNYPLATAIRYPRGHGEGVSLDWQFKEIPLGKAELLKEGKDILIIAIGSPVWPAYRVSLELAKEGYQVGVINARFLKPLDEDLILQEASKVSMVITVEENCPYGGLSSAVAELLLSNGLKVKFKKITLPDKFVEHGELNILRDLYGFTEKSLLSLIKSFLN